MLPSSRSSSVSLLLIFFSIGIFVSLPYVAAQDGGHNINDPKVHNPPNADLGPHVGDPAHDDGKLPKKHYKHQMMKLGDTPECGQEVQKYCSEKMDTNNLLILDCLQNDESTADGLSDECQHFLWTYKYNLTHNDGFDKASNKDCSSELAKLSDCRAFQAGEGKRIPCLIEHFDEVESKNCQKFLSKMASIVFSDFRFMDFFMKDCNQDIIETKCGRLPDESEDDSPHLQGSVVACLNKHRKGLQPKCKKSLLRVAELQGDDFHLDRPLYYACKDDRENFCSDTVAGDGAVFKCLFNHLGNPKLSQDCRVRLEARQELISEDVKVDKTFYEACKADIKRNHCGGDNDMEDDDVETDLGRSRVLLCLEKAHNDVSSPNKKVHAECLQQMFELRSELMQDYKISPELVSACEKEIDELCEGLEEGGNTIQCLMSNVADKKVKKTMGDACKAQVAQLLHVANPFEDIILDRPLQRACGQVARSACHNLPHGDGNMVNCLLENLDHADMTDECEDRLLEIQYFAVRDFKLDHHLFKACKEDADKLCHNKDFDNPRVMKAENGPLTFACLHRHFTTWEPEDVAPSKKCQQEIKRIMKERADRVSLMPEVEDKCMKELSEICSEEDEHLEKGGEMECLQANLDSLKEGCKEVVSRFTEEQSHYLDMDRILMKSCTPMMKEFCQDVMEKSDVAADMLDCLIEHKNHVNMDAKCAVGIEHHQLISLKDFRFNHKFREACQDSVNDLCMNKKTKFAVVSCLSEHVRNDTLLDKSQRVEKKCRKQLRFELLQRGENIKLDPELAKNCDLDVKTYCKKSNPGNAEVIECLKKHQKKLSDKCHRLLFKREEVAAVVGDYALLHTCKKMIRKVCKMDMSEPEIFDCLKSHKDDMDFDESCRSLVLKRQAEQAQDFRLNPHIQKACRHDIPKFCAEVYNENHPPAELEGAVINCLKKKFISKTKTLSRNCEFEIKSLVKEAALDINLNPVMMKVCKDEIKRHCLDQIHNVRVMSVDDGDRMEGGGDGAIIECLKQKFMARVLRNEDCKKEVAYAISESRVDINVDPLLHSSCQKDLITLCGNIQQGQGRQMACLLAHLDASSHLLTPACKGMLDRRKTLWELAAQVAPFESFSEIYEQVSLSPSRNYFLAVIFTVIGIIFIVGMTCGRVTKRIRAEVKNK